MADLQLWSHSLVTRGPIGIDDTGQQWLNGERPLEWDEQAACRRQFGADGWKLTTKDDELGWLDDGLSTGWNAEDERTGDILLHPGFAEERASSPDPFERPNESWRQSEFFQSDRNASLGESSQLVEALKSGLPLTTVEQYDSNIFSKQLFPTTGQEIVLEEDRRLVPSILRKLSEADMWELIDGTTDANPVGDIRRRWKLARRGPNGYNFYLRWMASRREVCKRFFPQLSNLLWYLDGVGGVDWYKVGRVWVRGSMGITGLQLMVKELWGPGYILHQRCPESWFNRATKRGPDRILHMTLKCHHIGNSHWEGREDSRCTECCMTARLFDMGYVSTAYFIRFIEAQYLVDVFDSVYLSACSDFHKHIYWLMEHITHCGLHMLQAEDNPPDYAAISVRNRPCFAKYDAIVKATDAKLLAAARKRLASHTMHQKELLLSEGSLFDYDFEGEPSTDLRGEQQEFHWDVNW